VGAECYVYGYALVIMDITRRVLTAVPRPNLDGTAAPINQFARMPHYVSPVFKNVVRISLNSLWTTGFMDLQREPMVLSVPDTAGRYYVFSVMDMWTNVFASLGKRTTGTGPGAFLFVGRNWNGTAPSDIRQVFHCPTRYAWVLGQTQCDGEQEFAAVNRLQAQYKLTPLSAWGHPYEPPELAVDPGVPLDVTPVDQVARMDARSSRPTFSIRAPASINRRVRIFRSTLLSLAASSASLVLCCSCTRRRSASGRAMCPSDIC
jgi:hypothetical protein